MQNRTEISQKPLFILSKEINHIEFPKLEEIK